MKSKVDFFREVDVGNLRASTGGWFRVPRLWMDQDMGQRILVLTVCNICFSTNASFTVPSIPSRCTSFLILLLVLLFLVFLAVVLVLVLCVQEVVTHFI